VDLLEEFEEKNPDNEKAPKRPTKPLP